MKVLLSAFACAPNKGSEPGVGWNWAMALAKENDVMVITREENRSEIEEYRSEHDLPFKVEYFGIDWFEKHKSIPFQKNLYTSRWQREVVGFAQKLNQENKFDLCHHITYASYKYPSELYKLGIPLVVGPVGGGEKTPPSCRRVFSLRTKMIEAIHDLQIDLTTRSSTFKKMCNGAARILLTTTDTYNCMPTKIRHKCGVMQTIGIDQTEILQNGYPVWEDSKPVEFLFIGNVLPLKGVMLLVDIAEKLKDENIVFGVVGDGPEKEKMVNKIKGKSLEKKFRFYGKIDRAEVLTRLDKAQAFIFPSFHDSGAMVVLEAMARRVPVVALATGGPGVHVTEKTGYGINARQSYENIIRDFSDVCKVIIRGYEKGTCLDMYSKIDNATSYLLNECTWDGKAEKMQAEYEKLVNVQ